MTYYWEPTTPEQALTEALFLALMAPDDEKAQAAAMLAEEVAAGLDEATVGLPKAGPLKRFGLDPASA